MLSKAVIGIVGCEERERLGFFFFFLIFLNTERLFLRYLSYESLLLWWTLLWVVHLVFLLASFLFLVTPSCVACGCNVASAECIFFFVYRCYFLIYKVTLLCDLVILINFNLALLCFEYLNRFSHTNVPMFLSKV